MIVPKWSANLIPSHSSATGRCSARRLFSAERPNVTGIRDLNIEILLLQISTNLSFVGVPSPHIVHATYGIHAMLL